MGVDIYSGVLDERPAEWIKSLLVGLLTMESRLYRALNPTPDQAQPDRDMDEEV